ncbi:MAG: quinone-dependent dihydroorotate dehydrogenase [Pseudomonadota bacterium]
MSPFRLARPLLFTLDAERAHRATIAALKSGLIPARRFRDPVLATTVAGIDFPNPLGMAAGFDKDAEVPGSLLGLGFGFVEVGTLTPLPQTGNARPRVFRLVSDRAVINRLGFNNGGIDKALKRLRQRHWRGGRGIIGINIGANKDSADRLRDYEICTEKAAPVADYLTINISSPNTPGLRALQSKDALAELLARVAAARAGRRVPLFLKVAPDLTDEDIDDIAAVALAADIDGLIVSNTTISRPVALVEKQAAETGGLSGAPLAPLAAARLRAFRRALGTRLPLIAVGGISSADDAYARIRAGASLVQLYTAMVYAGPGLPRELLAGLAARLKADGFARVADAVGVDADASHPVPAEAGS